MLIELDPVDRITADADGPPGQRTFYVQGRKGDRIVTVLVEKQQVQLLAASVVEILSRLDAETAELPAEEPLGLEEPIIPEWRAGRLSIGYEEDRDLILLEIEELVTEEVEDEEDEEGDEEDEALPAGAAELAPATVEPSSEGNGEEGVSPFEGLEELDDLAALQELQELGELQELDLERELGQIRFWATREQMLAMARHGAAVCAAGRPRCQLCGNPIDPEGHQCPALNGHRDLGA